MPDVVGRVRGGDQDGGDGGLRVAVHVRRAVQQLRGLDALGNQPEEAQFDITRPQHRAGLGVLKTGRGLVEGILAGQHGTATPLEFFVRCAADPFGTDGPGSKSHCKPSYLKKGLRIQSTHPGGRNAANSSVTRNRESVKR